MTSWSIYLLRNERGALYAGISTDPSRRLVEHRRGLTRGAKYTRACKELEMVYCCELGSRSLALQVEVRIKALRKKRKEALVAEHPGRKQLLEVLGLAGRSAK